LTWIRLDDQFPDHPKVVLAGPQAAWLYVAGLCYCSRHLTDGVIPKALVPRLTDFRGSAAKKLVEAGLWDDEGDVYRVHDYLLHQESRSEVEAKRQARREAGSKGGRSKPQAKLEQTAKQNGTKTEPEKEEEEPTEEVTPPTPPPGGSRANGTNPRALAAQRERDRIMVAINGCETCGDNPAYFCDTCTGLRRKLSAVAS
jgi:hypothetical protein